MPKGNSSRRGLINVALNGLVSTGVIAGFRTWKWRARPRRGETISVAKDKTPKNWLFWHEEPRWSARFPCKLTPT